MVYEESSIQWNMCAKHLIGPPQGGEKKRYSVSRFHDGEASSLSTRILQLLQISSRRQQMVPEFWSFHTLVPSLFSFNQFSDRAKFRSLSAGARSGASSLVLRGRQARVLYFYIISTLSFIILILQFRSKSPPLYLYMKTLLKSILYHSFREFYWNTSNPTVFPPTHDNFF